MAHALEDWLESEDVAAPSASSGPAAQKLCKDDLALNERQRYALDRAVKGESLFVTGASGTGKTEWIRIMARTLQALGDKVALTSAHFDGALHLGGTTIQSFCGLKKLDEDWANLEKEVQLNYVKAIWNGINVVVIDDVSLLDPHDLRKILFVAQRARTVKTPLQWILVGDFLSSAPATIKPTQERPAEALDMAFQLPEWPKLIHRTVVFTDDLRRDLTDPQQKAFSTILDDLRRGAANQVKWAADFQQQLDVEFPPDLPVTKLYPKYEDVCAENDHGLRRLTTPEYKFQAQRGFQVGNDVCPLHVPKSRQHLNRDVLQILEKLSLNEHKKTRLLNFLQRHAVVDNLLTLKAGARVILMADLHQGHQLVRGAQGVVTGFTASPHHYPIVRFARCECVVKSYMWTVNYTETTRMWFSQIPLRLGWAHSLKRLRGLTLSHVEVRMRDMFGYGEVYDVLSKVRTLQGVRFVDIGWSAIKAHPLCVAFYEDHQEAWQQAYVDWLQKEHKKQGDAAPYVAEDHIPRAAKGMDRLEHLRGPRPSGLKRPRNTAVLASDDEDDEKPASERTPAKRNLSSPSSSSSSSSPDL